MGITGGTGTLYGDGLDDGFDAAAALEGITSQFDASFARQSAEDRLNRVLATFASGKYGGSSPHRTDLFRWTDFGLDQLRRQVRNARVPTTHENLFMRGASVVRDAARRLGVYEEISPSACGAPQFSDVVDLVLALGRKDARLLMSHLQGHAEDLVRFCVTHNFVPVVNPDTTYSRFTNMPYTLSLFIKGAARMVYVDDTSELLVVAKKGNPLPLLQSALGPSALPFLDATLRHQAGQFSKGMRIIGPSPRESFNPKRRARRAASRRAHAMS